MRVIWRLRVGVIRKKQMQTIEQSREIPPIYEVLKRRFGIDWDGKAPVMIAWEGKIHCKNPCNAAEIVHEAAHLREQAKIGNEAWWRLYLDSDVFRFEQELIAYKAEADFIRKHVNNREAAFHMIREIVKNFSSPTYGNIVTREEAWKLLK